MAPRGDAPASKATSGGPEVAGSSALCSCFLAWLQRAALHRLAPPPAVRLAAVIAAPQGPAVPPRQVDSNAERRLVNGNEETLKEERRNVTPHEGGVVLHRLSPRRSIFTSADFPFRVPR
ncbi:hypothetical protein EYF80_053542 [Liparis tanakae]|uniref:Uncharacterized protein n=1 Tax=Liparis tanakae TaxID=230148 RepID=A0A4Z2F597_9TELE|nr:hypothetical protein EYF80_053542 [Liparis tanakae]